MRFLLLLAVSTFAFGQSTQGLIAGKLTDVSTQAALSGAKVSYENLAINLKGSVKGNPSGYYAIPLLPPGMYRVRIESMGYQSQELRELEVAVGSVLNLNFALRPLEDVFGENRNKTMFVTGDQSALEYFGPDLNSTKLLLLNLDAGRSSPLETGVSSAIDPNQIQNLPLSSRDVYATLVLQPGVTADSGTARGLGISVNGQRVSSSNFLLDGVENNNSLTSGPLTPVAPEAVQEYRISINNFSAEYGRTSGFLANAVTRSGGNEWHGLGYFYGKNEALNAADFQQNLKGFARTPLRESQPGFSLGGPVLRQRLFVAGSYEYFRFRSRLDPVTIGLPTSYFLSYCEQKALSCAKADSPARKLLENPQFRPPPIEDRTSPTAIVSLAPTSSVDRVLVTPRVDSISKTGKHRWMGRYAYAGSNQPDAGWTPYTEFQTPLRQTTSSLAAGAVSHFRPWLTNELRLGWSRVEIRFDQAHPEVPTLDASIALPAELGLVLPGTRNYYSLMDRNRVWQVSDNLVFTGGKHQFKGGGGVFVRNLDSYLKVNQSGYYIFGSLDEFSGDKPRYREVSIARREFGLASSSNSRIVAPNANRSYASLDGFLFAQDSYRVNSRLNINLGARMDRFGDPRNIGGVKDGLLLLDDGQSIAAQIKGARVDFGGRGDQRVYTATQTNWAVRGGFAFQPFVKQKLVVRGAYGIFYDRPYDNLWSNVRNNDVLIAGQNLSGFTNYLEPMSSTLAGLKPNLIEVRKDVVNVTAFPTQMEQASVQSAFLGIAQRLADGWSWEWNGQFSIGRNLTATDQLNRKYSETLSVSNLDGLWNPNLGLVSYRNSDGKSLYRATTLALRRQGRNLSLQAGYTLGIAKDNQSEPLVGEFNFVERSRGGSGLAGLTSFTRQLDWGSDFARSDFDQSHNLVFYSIWKLPKPKGGRGLRLALSDWNISQLGAFRSGRPFSVLATEQRISRFTELFNNRANRCRSIPAEVRRAVNGGVRLLETSAFCNAEAGKIGDSGRNSFTGPGLYNLDVSLARRIALRERYRLLLRADAFNVLNHANLGNPETNLDFGPSFGIARYGRQERSSGFPLQTPLRETARQIQFLLRLEF